ncbi:MAG: glycosyltransferase [Bacteroidales bacterium]|nr:glycosyltransferase [Bacteroidales bacterium]
MINILYISYDGMTDPLGESQVIPYLKELSKNEIKITILSAEKQAPFEARKNYINNILKDSNIDWFPIKYTKKPPIISTVIDIRKIYKKAVQIYHKTKFDIVHCRSYIAAHTGLILKQKYGVKFIFDMRGFYADERVDGNLWPQSNPIYKQVYKYFKNKEKSFLKNADYTISLTYAGKDIINNKFGFPNIPIKVIPCCADTDLFDYKNIETTTQEKLQTDLNIDKNDFVLSYLGSLGTWYMTEEMIKLFVILLKYKPKAKLLIITKDNYDLILELAKKHKIDPKHLIIRSANRLEVPLMLSLSHVSIFFIKPVFSKKASSPTKLAEILGMGIPIICNANVGDIDKFVPENNLGVMIDSFDTEALNKTCKEIDNLTKINKKHLRTVAVDLFSLDKGVKEYLSVYKNLMSK